MTRIRLPRKPIARLRSLTGAATFPGAASSQTSRTLGLELCVTPGDGQIRLDLQFRADVRCEAIWGFAEDSAVWARLGRPVETGPPGGYEALLDLRAAARLAGRGGSDGDLIQLFVDVIVPIQDVRRLETETEVALVVVRKPKDGRDGVYRLRVGGFRHTSIAVTTATTGDGHRFTAHPTRTGHLNVAVDRDLEPIGEIYVQRLSTARGRLRLQGRVTSFHGDLTSATLLLKGRGTGLRWEHPLPIRFDRDGTAKDNGNRWHRFDLDTEWTPLLDLAELDDDILDAWVILSTEQSPEPFDIRVGQTKFWTRYRTKSGSGQRGEHAALLQPYYTFKAKQTSFHLNLFAPDTMDYLDRALRTRHLLRLARRGRRPVWLVGELPYKAQDTGLAFFRHLRTNHPEIDAYYVLRPDSPDQRNVQGLGNVLPYRSKSHIRATLVADRIFSSHHPDFLYPVRTKRFTRAVRGTKIFLQHGVMGTKWMVPNYGKNQGGFETDLFVVSSEREREYIIGDFGYEPGEVVVTGLSRFDSLLDPDTPVRRQLLILPTWRDWLADAELYLESDYHARWTELLHHPRLHEIAAQHDLEIVFCLHPNMQRFTTLFSDVPVRVISQGEVDVQQLMKQSAVLVTDYSSVGFDFSFLHRPVLYYQFDQERFLGRWGSHLDLDVELPGPILFDLEDLLARVEQTADNDLQMDPMYLRRADRFLAHRDRRSSERIYQAAVRAKRSSTWLHRIAATDIPTAGARYFRRSPAYFPAMRLLLKALRRLPADDSLVLFESGVGRQYADSPRYVYEELLRRQLPLRKVWVYNGKIFQRDERTKVVPRLSPSYFWYLGRARYWVNNQNFPHYVERRPDTVYVQTWHGTPLKRLLHDLDSVVGRDSGYLGRVTKAASQWSLLASPSAWATDRMRSAFQYDGPVVEVGYPRNDIFFRPDRDALAASVRRRLGIAADKTVVLYAPTFRDDQATAASRFAFRLALDLDAMRAALGDDVVVLIRRHGLAVGLVPIPPEHAASIKDVSSYPEIQELFVASDVLVTDYSSVFFDFACLRRPMIFYAYDLDSYRDELRGFYLDYESNLPGPIVTTEKELYAALQNLDAVSEEYAARYDGFIAQFSPRDDGQAASRLVDEMLRRGQPTRRRGRSGKKSDSRGRPNES